MPIHPRIRSTLKRLIGKRTTGFLFEGLDVNRHGQRGDAIGKRFTRLKTKAGHGATKVFHSIRHTVSNMLEAAGVAENLTADIVGHAKTTMSYGLYSGRGATRELLAGASQVLAASTAIIGADGLVSDVAVEQIATGLGIEPGEARSRIAVVMKGYADEAVSHTAKSAGTSNAVAAEALQAFRQGKPSAFREAAERHAHTGMPNYGTAVTDYIAALEQTNPQRILSYPPVPGRQVYKNQSSGRIMVKLPDGTETTWDNAVRQRWITVK